MPFRIHCTCGPGGTMHEVLAERVNHPTRKPLFFGDSRGTVVPMNRCVECQKLWPALRHRGPKAPPGQLTIEAMVDDRAKPRNYRQERRLAWTRHS